MSKISTPCFSYYNYLSLYKQPCNKFFIKLGSYHSGHIKCIALRAVLNNTQFLVHSENYAR